MEKQARCIFILPSSFVHVFIHYKVSFRIKLIVNQHSKDCLEKERGGNDMLLAKRLYLSQFLFSKSYASPLLLFASALIYFIQNQGRNILKLCLPKIQRLRSIIADIIENIVMIR